MISHLQKSKPQVYCDKDVNTWSQTVKVLEEDETEKFLDTDLRNLLTITL